MTFDTQQLVRSLIQDGLSRRSAELIAGALAPSAAVPDQLPPHGGGVSAVVAGSGISVDATDPANPIVAAIGDGSVQVAHLRLEPAWIIAHSTDFATQVLVAGDATKAIIPLAGVVSLTYATTAYTGAGATDTDLLVGFGTPTGTPADMLGGPLSVWSATANTVAQLPQFANGGSQLVSQPPGADLRLYLLGSGLADGDSPVDVWVTYVLQTL